MSDTFFKKYFSQRVVPIWCILILDLLIVMFSCWMGFVLRYAFGPADFATADLLVMLAVAVVVSGVTFRLFHTYQGILRYSSFNDIARIFIALTVIYVLLAVVTAVCYLVSGSMCFPLSVVVIAYAVNTGLMVLSRVFIKVLHDLVSFDRKHSENVFIYGTKQGGVAIAKAMRVGLQHAYRLRGFASDDPNMIGKELMGVSVHAFDPNLIEVMNSQGATSLIVSPLKAEAFKGNRAMADMLLENGIRLLTSPPMSELDAQSLAPSQIRTFQIEDLLMREPVELDLKKIAATLEGKRVLVTGAAGSIGSEIVRQVASFNPYQLILVDQAETPLHDLRLEMKEHWSEIYTETIVANTSNQPRMEEIFRTYKPQYVFHAAAYKHVPMMEDNVSEAIQNNVASACVMANLAVEHGVEKFVMISTDKAVNPSNVMGCSKRICEIYVQSLAKHLQAQGRETTQFITTRFGNVLGSNGSVIPRFREQIERGGPVTVTHPDIIRYFMTIPEACRLVLDAGSLGHGGEIYIFDMGQPVKIVDLARRMIQLSGRTDVKIEFTGLRHGEKLYEELLNVRENTKPTDNDKIMIANVREYDFNDVKRHINELIDLSNTYDDMKIVAKMKEIVPEFKSLNSKFSVLDDATHGGGATR